MSTTTTTEEVRYCACGCGKPLVKSPSSRGRAFTLKKFIKGHHTRTREVQEKIQAGVQKSLEGGLIAADIKKRREEALAKRPLCQCGCGRPVHRAGVLHAKGCFDRPSQCLEILELAYQVTIGSHGFGRNTRGRLDHRSAKVWRVRDPLGRPYLFSNLSEWARQNTHLFIDDCPESKRPFWRRIATGFSHMSAKEDAACSYKGWTLVSAQEYIIEGGVDPLGRDVETLLKEWKEAGHE